MIELKQPRSPNFENMPRHRRGSRRLVVPTFQACPLEYCRIVLFETMFSIGTLNSPIIVGYNNSRATLILIMDI